MRAQKRDLSNIRKREKIHKRTTTQAYSRTWTEEIETHLYKSSLLSSSGLHQLTFYLTYFLTFFLAYLIHISATFSLACVLTFLLAFYLAYVLTFYILFDNRSDMYSDILSGILFAVLSDIYNKISFERGPPKKSSLRLCESKRFILNPFHLQDPFHIKSSRWTRRSCPPHNHELLEGNARSPLFSTNKSQGLQRKPLSGRIHIDPT